MAKQIVFTDDGSIEVDGVLYKRAEDNPPSPHSKTLLEIVRDWCDDDRGPTCLELVERVEKWLPGELEPNNETPNSLYEVGWNDCLTEIRSKL